MTPDPWDKARKFTAARIALGRAGGSLPTAAWLAFAGDHAAARDAVYAELDVKKLACGVSSVLEGASPSPVTPAEARGPAMIHLRTLATDRQTYLRRPDLGRQLDPAGVDRLAAAAAATTAPVDVAITVADGLSAIAAQKHAAAVVGNLIPSLRSRNFTLAPITIVTQARVAVQDPIGQLLRAKVSVILIGERPGLAAADSLGAYLVHNPGQGKTDADRNCVSNIRPDGFPPPAAAELIAWLIEQAVVRRISGVGLKDERGMSLCGTGSQPVSSSLRADS